MTAALGSPETGFVVVREGRAVAQVVSEREVDLAILDLQIGTMGGMAATMDLRLDESSGAIEHIPVLMLLDREADVNLARRSGAEGWIIKPLDALRLKRAVGRVANGEPYHEGPMSPTDAADDSDRDVSESGELVDADAVDS